MEDRCIFCNEIIPEGRQVCPKCEEAIIRIGSILQSQNATPEEVEQAYEEYEKERRNEQDRRRRKYKQCIDEKILQKNNTK